EVKARGRRGDGAGDARKNGLVALAIGGVVGAAEVRRQRDVTDALDRGRDVAGGGAQGDGEGAGVVAGVDARGELAIAEVDLGAGTQRLRRAADRKKRDGGGGGGRVGRRGRGARRLLAKEGFGRARAHEEELDGAAGAGLLADEARRHHARV